MATTLFAGDEFVFQGLADQKPRPEAIRARVRGVTLSGNIELEIASEDQEFDSTRTIQVPYDRFVFMVLDGIWRVTPETKAKAREHIQRTAATQLAEQFGMGRS